MNACRTTRAWPSSISKAGAAGKVKRVKRVVFRLKGQEWTSATVERRQKLTKKDPRLR